VKTVRPLQTLPQGNNLPASADSYSPQIQKGKKNSFDNTQNVSLRQSSEVDIKGVMAKQERENGRKVHTLGNSREGRSRVKKLLGDARSLVSMDSEYEALKVKNAVA